jgi:hypothetical protein
MIHLGGKVSVLDDDDDDDDDGGGGGGGRVLRGKNTRHEVVYCVANYL